MKDGFTRLPPSALTAIQSVCAAEGEDPALVVAVLDRESLCGDALQGRPRTIAGTLVGWGDLRRDARGFSKFHAFGACQADLGAAELVIRGMVPGFDLTTPEGQALWICRHVASSRRLLRLTFPDLDEARLEEAAVCAYNASIGAVAASLAEGKDPNLRTTNRDYGHDVIDRRNKLRRDRPGAFPQHRRSV